MERFKFNNNGDKIQTGSLETLIEYAVNCYNRAPIGCDDEMIKDFIIVNNVIYFHHNTTIETVCDFMDYLNRYTSLIVDYDNVYNSIIIMGEE